ncbi:MAG: hypothetical protein H6779_01100 [Candidatus Nomurabacteria bacterium]|nr:hypothetical protein [Candidatus Nomurabacteria bacterium]USN88026.1 MAG: hypothetical protein H6779_01100 [Candidatus Nomurabacteria bacterium]
MSKTIGQYKIAIIGPRDVVSGFKALGVEAFEAYSSEEALEQLKNIKQLSTDSSSSAYAVVCIIEDLMIDMDEKEYQRIMNSSFKPKEEASQKDMENFVNAVAAGRKVKELDANQTAGYLPAVVVLPGTSGSQGFAEARLRKLSEKAIGAAII